MKNTQSSTPQLDRELNTHWMIHIYDRNRRLRCSLDPSHGWSFLSGTLVGLLLAVLGINLIHLQPPQPSSVEDIAPFPAPMQLD
jgi:hypothetical protein